MLRYFSILFLTGFVILAGCDLFNPITPIIQIGVYWLEGEAHKYYDADEETITNAVKYALAELDMPISNETYRDDYLYIRADVGDRFKIKVKPIRENITKLSIRVNVFGDKPYAQLIYDKVDKYTGVNSFKSSEQLNSALRERPGFRRLNRRPNRKSSDNEHNRAENQEQFLH